MQRLRDGSWGLLLIAATLPIGCDNFTPSQRNVAPVDVMDREFLDILGGFGLYSYGIRHPKIVAAVKAQLDRSPQYSQEMLDPLRAQLARVLALLTPGKIQYGFFTNSGTEAVELRKEIARKLPGLLDVERQNQQAIKDVYISLELYNGPYKENAPDLLVGYCPGYRASWETAVGQVTEQVFHENTKAWSGDHCIDASFVPGVLFSNSKIESDNPRLMDIGPTVLDLFGVDVPGYMDGKPLAVKD